jgi:hypothetical protein
VKILWIALIPYLARKQTLAVAKDAQKQIAIQGITQAWNLNKFIPNYKKKIVV